MVYLGLFSLIIFNFITNFAAPLNINGNGVERFGKSKEDPIIKYYIDMNSESLPDKIREAFQVWEDVETSYLEFEEVDDQDEAEINITFGSTRNTEEYKVSTNSKGEITYNHWLLHESITSFDSKRQLSTLIHEVGHAVGLRHSTNKNSVMSYRRSSATTLTVDDKHALTLIYPDDDELILPKGCMTVKNNSNNTPFLEIFMLWFLMLVLRKIIARKNFVNYFQRG